MDTLKKNLSKLGLEENQLSSRELNILIKIQEYYNAYEEKNNSLKQELQNNKFNRKRIKDIGICSRQTLYTNKVINDYMLLLESQAEDISDVNETKYISRQKYNELKSENTKLISNAVDSAIKDAEIERLTRENKQLKDRISNLIKRLEQEQNKSKNFRNSKYLN